MDLEQLRQYCLSKAGTTEGMPFGDDTLVFKVLGRLFALVGLATPEVRVNLKCDPQRAVELREAYPDSIQPGYHMNKKHWNTVDFGGELSAEFQRELIDHSYDLVVQKMPKKLRDELKGLA